MTDTSHTHTNSNTHRYHTHHILPNAYLKIIHYNAIKSGLHRRKCHMLRRKTEDTRYARTYVRSVTHNLICGHKPHSNFL
jgi:hypothetical protein